ncbi:hypothetical protein SADO_03385 [Salinisphaera dokdonensis CL-ES53]|uniref:TVP38/TMEM64 family membrane protein n=1 Tax=Salinisphaera dokdonensis CL-ES53 TaxID=1304272 RepID=A0ABV2AX92_9GAMM
MSKLLQRIPAGYSLLALALLLVCVTWMLLPIDVWIESMSGWVERQGVWGVIVFGLIYALATLLMAPGAPMSLAAGLIFKWWGVPIVVVSATLGAMLAFMAGRHLARSRVERAIAKRPRLQALDRAVAADGWKIVGLLRLSPLIPFNAQNYFFGATNIGFLPFSMATAIAIIPGTVMYVYLGSIGAATGAGNGAPYWTLVIGGLVATLAVVCLVSHRARTLLAAHGVDNEDESKC